MMIWTGRDALLAGGGLRFERRRRPLADANMRVDEHTILHNEL